MNIFSGNIVCNNCSQGTWKNKRICNTCSKLIFNNNLIDSDDEDDDDQDHNHSKEELSPYNTPMLKHKEFSVCTVDTIDSGTTFDGNDEFMENHDDMIEYIDYDDIHNEQQNSIIDDIFKLPPTASITSPFSSIQPQNVMRKVNINNNNSINNHLYGINEYGMDLIPEDDEEHYTYNHYASQLQREWEREYQIKQLLVNGFVRKYWKILLQFNPFNEFPNEYIINYIVEILTISDSLDEYNTNLNIIINSRPLYHLKNYRRVQYIQRTKDYNMECYHTFGHDIISRGGKAIWKFKISGADNNKIKPCILIGIIESDKVSHFKSLCMNYDNGDHGESFNDEMNGGYALYTGDWNIYHKDCNKGKEFIDDFQQKIIDITPNDVIAVELDLTQKYLRKDRSKSSMTLKEYKKKSQCGTLKFIFNGSTKIFKNNGIAFDDIDINKSYKLAIGMYLRDKLAMYQVL